MLLQVLAEASEYIMLSSSFILRTNPLRLAVVEQYFHFKYQIMLDKSNILASKTCKSVLFLHFYSLLNSSFTVVVITICSLHLLIMDYCHITPEKLYLSHQPIISPCILDIGEKQPKILHVLLYMFSVIKLGVFINWYYS